MRDLFIILICFIMVCVGQAVPQISNQPDLSAYALKAELPQPADAIPPIDTLNGDVGVSLRYMRQDAPRPTISQRATVPVVAGAWSVTWARAFTSSAPIIATMPLTAAAVKPFCKTDTRNATSASGTCWQEATVVPPLLGIALVSPATPYTGDLMVVGLEPSQ